MAKQSQLVMRTGPNPGKVFALNKPEVYIGRDISNDIVINDAEVSRKHVRLIIQADQYVIEDLGSTNGTFINGQRISGPYMLNAGDSVQMGENVTMLYEARSVDADATAVMTPRDAAGLDVPSPAPEPAPPAAPAPPPPAPAPEPLPQPVPAPPVAHTLADVPESQPSFAAEPASTFTGTPGYQTTPPAEEAPSNRNRNMILAGCGCLVIVACIAVIGVLYYIDANDLWCAWLSIC